jgi:glycosyltransferase involved in cell wall biosynthesis
MRILIVHNTLNDSRSISGVLRHYAWMANEWNRAGHPTDFLAAKAGWPQIKQLAPGAGLVNSDGFFNATRHLHQTWRAFPAYGYRMITAHVLPLPVQYDIIYASTQLIAEVYPSLVLARRQKTRLAAKIHHVLASQPGRQSPFDKLFLWSERKTTRWLNKYADLIICGTELVAQDFHALEAGLGLTPRPTVQIGYGIQLNAFSSAPAPRKNFDVVALGRMHAHKGVFDLAPVWKQVVRQIPHARLVVIGEGPHRAQTEAMCKEFGLSDTVSFTGGISEEEKNRLLNESRIGLSLSYEEGWGLSINEFLAAGLPVVAYSLPIYAHVFPGQLELVQPGEKQAAAAALIELIKNEAKCRELGNKGRQFIQRYDYREVARAELDALQGHAQDGQRHSES